MIFKPCLWFINASRKILCFFLATEGSANASYVIEAQFSPPKPSEDQTKNLRTTINTRGRNIELEMGQGTWTVVITSRSSILLLVSSKLNQIELFSFLLYKKCFTPDSKMRECRNTPVSRKKERN